MTERIRIKICGLTRREDAQLALSCGAFALGFVFYPPSPRAITPAAAAAIIQSLKAPEQADGEAPSSLWTVGVFVNSSYDEMARIATASGLSHLQLHGDESPALCQQLQLAGFKVIKALRLRTEADLEQLAVYPNPVLLDAAVPGIWGGSGHQADWELAAQAAARGPLILAGGLGPANLQAALAEVKPWAFDLSSGVESAPGIKNAHLIKELFQRIV